MQISGGSPTRNQTRCALVRGNSDVACQIWEIACCARNHTVQEVCEIDIKEEWALTSAQGALKGNMVQNYASKRARPQPSEESLELAIADVRDKKLSLREAAASIEKLHAGEHESVGEGSSNTINRTPLMFNSKYTTLQVFTSEEETKIVKYAINRSKMCYGKTYYQLRKLAYGYALKAGCKIP
ncbi:hypothetical protein PR048_011382 [Dryococelus australis]|uniref:Uncharacterized protein n=1 Tax=Dryococelus australis TaxID=614101 RepID=A0ABQ9HM68_9NEOP|nr:hypothetical protein PR048_011382 [Dryococelus australis]